jgi:hypothetical protein
MKPTASVLLLVAFAVATSPARTDAQPPDRFDHLRCYRVVADLRDAEKAEGLTLTPDQIATFAEQSGCRLRSAKATEVCVPVAKSPSDSPSGDDLNADYVCYRVKCDSPVSKEPIPLEVNDPFGSGTLMVRQLPGDSTQSLCVPSRYRCKSGATNATLPFFDSFGAGSGTQLPPGWVEPFGDFAIAGGALVSGAGGDSIAVLNGVSAANVTVEADIGLASVPSDASAGLLLHAIGAPWICSTPCPSYYLGRIRKAGSTYHAEIVKNTGCSPSVLVSGEIASPTGRLRFVASGGSLTLSLDNVSVAVANDSSIGAGTVGVLANGSGVSFDNFQASF